MLLSPFCLCIYFFFYVYGDHRDLHVLTLSFPTRRSSDRMGIVSCLGNDQAGVEASLRTLKAGIRFIPEYAELGLRSQVAGQPEIDLDARIDRKLKQIGRAHV